MMKYVIGIFSNVQLKLIDKVVVFGGGLMGVGIVMVSVVKVGLMVWIKEVDDVGVGWVLVYVNDEIIKQVKWWWLCFFEGEQVMNQVIGSIVFDGFVNSDIVIEVVFEDFDLK